MVTIFDSDLSISEFEKVLQTKLETFSKFGPNVAFRDLGEGNGLVTEVGLLTADWTPADPSLPATFAIKIAAPQKKSNGNKLADLSRQTMNEEKIQRIVDYHNTEIFVLSKLKSLGVKAKVVEVYSHKIRANYNEIGYIIMKNYEGIANHLHMNNNLPSYAIEEVIHNIAAIHKSGEYFEQQEKDKMKGNMFQSTFHVMFEPEMIKNLGQLIKKFGGEMMSAEADEMIQVMDEMRQPEYLKFIDETCENLGIPRLLCHGDVWMCNMLWKKTGNSPDDEKYDLQALIDLQTAQFNCPAIDLVRLFTGCMSGKARQDDWEKHVQFWHSLMHNESGKAPYTLEQTLEAYRRVFPPAAFIVAGSIGAVGENIIKKQPTDEAKEVAHKNLLEKQHAMLKDIIKYHKRNMALIAEAKK